MNEITGSRHEMIPIGETARLVVLTGLSGAGKSESIRALEDRGYFCVENLPVALVPTFADLLSKGGGSVAERAAVVVDIRDPGFLPGFIDVIKKLRQRKSLGVVVIFLEASDSALVRRFSETRRPHPLAEDQSALEGILRERKKLKEVKKLADHVFDTSELTVHELRRAFMDVVVVGAHKRLGVTLLSFGYKNGIPLESDLLFDVRFLPNPYFVPELRSLTGLDESVYRYLDQSESTKTFLNITSDFLRFLIPRYRNEGKSYLTIGVGCTGGRHRSVMVVERLSKTLEGLKDSRLRIKHRDIFGEESRKLEEQ